MRKTQFAKPFGSNAARLPWAVTVRLRRVILGRAAAHQAASVADADLEPFRDIIRKADEVERGSVDLIDVTEWSRDRLLAFIDDSMPESRVQVSWAKSRESHPRP